MVIIGGEIVGVCKISGLPAYLITDGIDEWVECKASHQGECKWERVSKEEFIKALKKENALIKRLKEYNRNKPIGERILFGIPYEWCKEYDEKEGEKI